MSTYKDFHNDSLNNVVTDKQAIEQSIFNILTTRKGSLAGKPEFGCNLYAYLFEMIDHITINSMQTEIARCLKVYEPRIKVQSVDIYSQPEFNRVILSINYNFTGVETSSFETYTITLNTN